MEFFSGSDLRIFGKFESSVPSFLFMYEIMGRRCGLIYRRKQSFVDFSIELPTTLKSISFHTEMDPNGMNEREF